MLSETIKLAQDLIRRQSVSPDDAGCQSIIAERLKRIGFQIQFFNQNGVTNLWARRGTKSPVFTYVGHTDVVPVGEESHWKIHPFSATVENGYLHGRGAADMKGSVAAMVTACERYFSTQGEIRGSVSFLITSDEEDVAEDGTKYALEALGKEAQQIDWCLVGEPTSEKDLGDTIKIGRRGSLDGMIVVHGKQGHVAYPQFADNPIHKSGKLISALTSLQLNDGNADFPNTTFQISNVNSGVGAGNVIPEDLTLKFNFRFSPATTVEQLVQTVENICDEVAGRYSIYWSSPSDPYHNNREEFVDLVADAVETVLMRRPKRSTAGGTSDGRFVAKTNAQVVELGPLNATIHKVDECVSVNDLDKLSKVYELVLNNMFG